jgi:ATP-dependent Lon protease
VKTVLLPARNEKDLHDVPEATRSALRFVWLQSVDDAIRAALGEVGTRPPGGGFELV